MSTQKPDTPLQLLASHPKISRRTVLTGLTGIFLAGGPITFLCGCSNPLPNPPPDTIQVHFIYSTEKESWIKEAIRRFNKQQQQYNRKIIVVNVLGPGSEEQQLGSLDAVGKILSGEIMPTAWSPASFRELNILDKEWKKKFPGEDVYFIAGDMEPKSLVLSPLVFAVWQERATVLLKKYGGSIDWPGLHDAFKINTNGWAGIGGQSEWGDVKFGHTLPNKSNSGLLTTLLIAYTFWNEQRSLTDSQVTDGNFLKYLKEIDDSVGAFGRSSGTFFENVFLNMGPPAYDVITTYENLVLTHQQEAMIRQHQSLYISYPALNIKSDHPFVIMRGDPKKAEEQQAAMIFRDFLLNDDMQKLAVTLGFRPLSKNVHITDNIAGNVFLQQPSEITIPPDIENLVPFPNDQVIEELLTGWENLYKDPPIASG